MMMALVIGCTKIADVPNDQIKSYEVVGHHEQPTTRACITSNLNNMTQVPVLWSPGDAIGVFTETLSNVKLINKVRGENKEVVTFAAEASLPDVPLYAYYPYREGAGNKVASLNGTVPSKQPINLATGMIPGDYKIGKLLGSDNIKAQFGFTHIFSPICIQIDGTGTVLENDRLLAIELSVTRGNDPVMICGDFTFSAVDGTYTAANTASNKVIFDWTANSALDSQTMGFATLFPTVEPGDMMEFTIRTSAHTATFQVSAIAEFKANHIYTFPLKLSKYNMEVKERADISASGTFKAVTYNVDGLPSLINSDGPGSSGTTAIGQKVANSKWDVIGFSEDFDYHSQLKTPLESVYYLGTYRGSVDVTNVLLTADTDGLGFACNKSTCSFANEAWENYTDNEGGITSGANTCIKKGYRYYLVTLNDGTQIDFVITHMNTYGNDGRFDAQNKQLAQLAEYINTTISRNKRPLILMGDTNCRYTRNDFQEYFWKHISNVTYNDPWVDYYWNGVYPTFGTTSIMPADAPDPSAEELPLYSNQKGEVVDKIIYFNHPSSTVQIRAISYERDEDYAGMADHMPVVAEFYYEKK